MATKKEHGGERRGSGRAPLSAEYDTVGVCVRMTTLQRWKLSQLGGAAWIRAQLDKAKVPDA